MIRRGINMNDSVEVLHNIAVIAGTPMTSDEAMKEIIKELNEFYGDILINVD